MLKFSAVLHKFAEQGEKTGWTYIEIPAQLALQLKPGNKKSFRVKGYIDKFTVSRVALMPMGEGNFVMAINAEMRKGIGKRQGATVKVQLEVDDSAFKMSSGFMACLEDDPRARDFFNTLSPGHRNYFSKWIESAKTETTQTKRIAQAVNALAQGLNYGQMIRSLKNEKNKLL